MAAYATSADFVQAYGLDETFQLLLDEEQKLTVDALKIGLTALAPESAAPDSAAAAALERLERRLAHASSFMDGYLGHVVALPLVLASDSALIGTLQDCCLALTRCALADDPDNATERMDKTCENWRGWLKDISAGRVKLVDDAGFAPAASAGRIVYGAVPSAYDFDAMAAFGGGFRV